MKPPLESHLTGADLEKYSLGSIPPTRLANLEEHLLLCQRCRGLLAGIEPYNFVHFTTAGPFYSRVTKSRSGILIARQWASNFEAGKEFRTLKGAVAYLARNFARLFPEHRCTPRCGPTNA